MILFLISTLRILCDCDRDCSGIYGGLFMLVMMYGWTLIDIKKKISVGKVRVIEE